MPPGTHPWAILVYISDGSTGNSNVATQLKIVDMLPACFVKKKIRSKFYQSHKKEQNETYHTHRYKYKTRNIEPQGSIINHVSCKIWFVINLNILIIRMKSYTYVHWSWHYSLPTTNVILFSNVYYWYIYNKVICTPMDIANLVGGLILMLLCIVHYMAYMFMHGKRSDLILLHI